MLFGPRPGARYDFRAFFGGSRQSPTSMTAAFTLRLEQHVSSMTPRWILPLHRLHLTYPFVIVSMRKSLSDGAVVPQVLKKPFSD
jgi:hypothetical protein